MPFEQKFIAFGGERIPLFVQEYETTSSAAYEVCIGKNLTPELTGGPAEQTRMTRQLVE